MSPHAKSAIIAPWPTLSPGNVQMAVLLGLFDSDNYNWRSMTSPGITGLFNPNCLQSGAENLMKCYPGDNTYSGAPLTAVSLINPDNQFHSITTTVDVNGKILVTTLVGPVLLGPPVRDPCGLNALSELCVLLEPTHVQES